MLISLLELASNKALEYDSTSLSRLSKLQGKTMALHIKNVNQTITVVPHIEGLELSGDSPENADVTLSITLGALIKISRDGLENVDLKPGELDMSGDPIIGQRFAQVMSELNIDWEAMLAEQIGDAPARAATTVAGHAKEFAQESRNHLHEFVSNTVKQDLGIVADITEVDQFLDDVDTLRANVDRLSARLSALVSKI